VLHLHKHYNGKVSKDAHDNFCKQSRANKESLRRLKEALVHSGVLVDFCEYIQMINPI